MGEVTHGEAGEFDMSKEGVMAGTDPEEFKRFLNLLPPELGEKLWLIPLRRHSKKPDIPKGRSTLDRKFKLTPELAVERLRHGLNVGIMAKGDVVLLDIDATYKSNCNMEVKQTLGWRTRNGGLCNLYINMGIDFNAAREGYGELRAVNQYVVAPGSYVPPDGKNRGGDGCYVIINPIPPATLTPEEIPSWLVEKQYRSKPVKIRPEPPPVGGWTNKYGIPLELFRRIDKKLDDLLNELNPAGYGYPSRSEADMAVAGMLWRYGFTEKQIANILRHYRPYEKTMRDDYLELTIGKVVDDQQLSKDRLLSLIAEAEGSPQALRRLREVPVATEIGDTFAYVGDRPFKGRVQVVALGFPEARFTRIRFVCGDSSKCEVAGCPLMNGLLLDVEDETRFDPSAFATYFDTNNLKDALSVYFERTKFPRCSAWHRKAVPSGDREKAITRGILLDLQAREGRAWFIHGPRCDLSKAPNWIIADGWLCKGARGRIGVLIMGFTHESEVLAPSMEEVERAREILRRLPEGDKIEGSGAFKVAKIIRKKVNAKGGEVVKGFTADLLTTASPVWVKTPESEGELGATTCELGPSTNYKSQRSRFLVSWLGAGKYLHGRKTEAGLTAGLEKIEGLGWVVKKGALPSADLSFIIVDNAPPYVLDEQIESRRNGVVSIAGIKSMEIWARTRLKLLNNPLQPFDELVYKCVGLKMFDSKLIARLTFAIYTYGISVDERYDPAVSTLTTEEEAVLEAARTVLRWNLSQEATYTVPLSLWPKIMEYSKQLELKYGCEDIPLLLRNIPYKLAVLAYSFALLEGEAEPTERHYRLAYEWLDFCAHDIELDKYAEVQKMLHNLSNDEYRAISKALLDDIAKDVKEKGGTLRDTYLFRIVDYIVKHGKSRRDELAAYLEVDEKTVTRKVNVLKGLGLLRSDKDGYSFTPKGVKFVKQWLVHVSEVPDVPTFEGETEKNTSNTCVTPKSGDMRDSRDMSKPRCEICGDLAVTHIVRGDGVHWLCGKCLKDWEGKL
jgi:hypothetical protein